MAFRKTERHGQALPAVPAKLESGVDELNFAEFPVCFFGSNPAHISASDKTLEFQDEVPDPANPGKTVTRTVTVSGTNKYGLPTVLDDWVILGLFQMAKLQDFPKKLYFTRYHLLKLLGWGTNARDYNKLTESLRRIQGVQFNFEKAWWDGRAKSWVSRTFNLYQDLEIYEDENSTMRPKPDVRQSTFSFACSSFEWSEFLHSNFMNRALKGLNFHFVKSLKKPTTKRLFRFLDKRFYKRNRLEFDLHEFAEAHMGLRKGQKVGDIKRTLLTAICELENFGYLKRMTPDERFPKVRPGQYRVVLVKGEFDATQHESELEQLEVAEASAHTKRIAKALMDRGVSEREAFRLASASPDSLIMRHVDVFDWETEEGKKFPNPGGYLRARIMENYGIPPGFVPRAERERLARQKKERTRAQRAQAERRQTDQEAVEAEREAKISKFWESLSPKEREEAEQKALARANRTQLNWINREGPLKQATMRNLLDAYAMEIAEEKCSPRKTR